MPPKPITFSYNAKGKERNQRKTISPNEKHILLFEKWGRSIGEFRVTE